MNKTIKRRDFLNGIAVSSLAAAAPFQALALGAATGVPAPAHISAEYYPPTLTGMRGSHKGSFEAAHALVMQGKRPSDYNRVDDVYDLVVVGAGISGLAAAYLYRQKSPEAKILLLDNHDDFGGHAKRNEFHSGGKMLLSFGGSINLEQDAMSPAAYQLLEDIGVDFKALQNAGAEDYSLANSAAPFGLYLGSDLYGENQLAAGFWQYTWAGEGDYRAQINSLKLPEDDKAKLISLASGEKDYINDIPLADKEHYLRSTSYASFLYDRVGLSAAGARIAEPWSRAIFGLGIESISIREALAVGAPGYNALGLAEEKPATDAAENGTEKEESGRYPMFPDGNASVARLFVRKLIPEIAPGTSMQSLVTARFDYSTLDRASSAVRLRLNSTAVNVTHHGSLDKSKAVDVAYVQGGQAFKVRGKHCILAGYNGMIPHLCPELPQAQKESLAYGVKTPFVWANVLLKNGAAVRAEPSSVYQCPGSAFELVAHAPPVALGSYQPQSNASDPMVMFMGHVPAPHANKAVTGNQSARDLYRLGRHKLFTTPFSEFEAAIIEQLTGMFGHNGFDAKRDIEAITLNRWSHGYAYEYMDLHDPQWAEGQAPHELGRKPFGRISIANSDSEAYAYVQAAIDAAVRAVDEISVS